MGFEIRSQIIWSKDRFALSRGHYHWHFPSFKAQNFLHSCSRYFLGRCRA